MLQIDFEIVTRRVCPKVNTDKTFASEDVISVAILKISENHSDNSEPPYCPDASYKVSDVKNVKSLHQMTE